MVNFGNHSLCFRASRFTRVVNGLRTRGRPQSLRHTQRKHTPTMSRVLRSGPADKGPGSSNPRGGVPPPGQVSLEKAKPVDRKIHLLIPSWVDVGTGLSEQYVKVPTEIVDLVKYDSAFKIRDYSLLQAVWTRASRKARELSVTPEEAMHATAIGFIPTMAEIQSIEHINTSTGRQLIGNVNASYTGSPEPNTIHVHPTTESISVVDTTLDTMSSIVKNWFTGNEFRPSVLHPEK